MIHTIVVLDSYVDLNINHVESMKRKFWVGGKSFSESEISCSCKLKFLLSQIQIGWSKRARKYTVIEANTRLVRSRMYTVVFHCLSFLFSECHFGCQHRVCLVHCHRRNARLGRQPNHNQH